MTNSSSDHVICQVCGATSIYVFLEIMNVPVHCNVLCNSRVEALEKPKGDIRLGFCEVCGYIFNLAFRPDRIDYTGAYENSLHFSSLFEEYAKRLAGRLIERYGLWGKDIIEIGCGKGEFLSMLCNMGGNRGLGFDPSYDETGDGNGSVKDVNFIKDFYSNKYRHLPTDLICSRHVLEHLPDPRDFMLQIHHAIGSQRNKVVFLEVPNVLYTLRHLGIWDIIYEHCSYFSVPSLVRLFRETGFAPHDVYTAFGGQFLCLEASPTGSMPATEAGLAHEVDELRDLVEGFTEHYRAKVDLWNRNLNHLLENGKRIVVWGAGSKGVTFLNTIAGGERISHVIDVNPRKQGMYVAGTGQRIMVPESLAGLSIDTILVMNPMYKDEIRHLSSQAGVTSEVVTV